MYVKCVCMHQRGSWDMYVRILIFSLHLVRWLQLAGMVYVYLSQVYTSMASLLSAPQSPLLPLACLSSSRQGVFAWSVASSSHLKLGFLSIETIHFFPFALQTICPSLWKWYLLPYSPSSSVLERTPIVSLSFFDNRRSRYRLFLPLYSLSQLR
jgi:hypothetical protein